MYVRIAEQYKRAMSSCAERQNDIIMTWKSGKEWTLEERRAILFADFATIDYIISLNCG